MNAVENFTDFNFNKTVASSSAEIDSFQLDDLYPVIVFHLAISTWLAVLISDVLIYWVRITIYQLYIMEIPHFVDFPASLRKNNNLFKEDTDSKFENKGKNSGELDATRTDDGNDEASRKSQNKITLRSILNYLLHTCEKKCL